MIINNNTCNVACKFVKDNSFFNENIKFDFKIIISIINKELAEIYC